MSSAILHSVPVTTVTAVTAVIALVLANTTIMSTQQGTASLHAVAALQWAEAPHPSHNTLGPRQSPLCTTARIIGRDEMNASIAQHELVLEDDIMQCIDDWELISLTQETYGDLVHNVSSHTLMVNCSGATTADCSDRSDRTMPPCSAASAAVLQPRVMTRMAVTVFAADVLVPAPPASTPQTGSHWPASCAKGAPRPSHDTPCPFFMGTTVACEGGGANVVEGGVLNRENMDTLLVMPAGCASAKVLNMGGGLFVAEVTTTGAEPKRCFAGTCHMHIAVG